MTKQIRNILCSCLFVLLISCQSNSQPAGDASGQVSTRTPKRTAQVGDPIPGSFSEQDKTLAKKLEGLIPADFVHQAGRKYEIEAYFKQQNAGAFLCLASDQFEPPVRAYALGILLYEIFDYPQESLTGPNFLAIQDALAAGVKSQDENLKLESVELVGKLLESEQVADKLLKQTLETSTDSPALHYFLLTKLKGYDLANSQSVLVEEFVRSSLDHPAPIVRLAALDFYELKSETISSPKRKSDVIQRCLSLLDSDEPGIVAESAQALASLINGETQEQVRNELESLLKHPSGFVRASAASALESTRSYESIPRLVALFGDNADPTYELEFKDHRQRSRRHQVSGGIGLETVGSEALAAVVMMSEDVELRNQGVAKLESSFLADLTSVSPQDSDFDTEAKKVKAWSKENRSKFRSYDWP